MLFKPVHQLLLDMNDVSFIVCFGWNGSPHGSRPAGICVKSGDVMDVKLWHDIAQCGDI